MTNNTSGVKQSSSKWINQQLILLQSRKENIAYAYLALTLFTVSFFGFFALIPAFTTISNLQKQLNDSNAVYHALATKLTTLRSLDKQYLIIQSELGLVFDAIPTSAQIPLLTAQIETLARQNNLLIKTFTVAPVTYYPLEKNNDIYSFLFSLSAEGTQSDINNFMDSIANLNRIVSIDKITTGQIKDGALQVTLSGKAFYQKNE